jgi:hypothetical protein
VSLLLLASGARRLRSGGVFVCLEIKRDSGSANGHTDIFNFSISHIFEHLYEEYIHYLIFMLYPPTSSIS